jgi:hypothetical protein
VTSGAEGGQQRELETESVSFLVCKRNGVTSKSETYLANFVNQNTTVGNLDIYQVMRAAGQIETLWVSVQKPSLRIQGVRSMTLPDDPPDHSACCEVKAAVRNSRVVNLSARRATRRFFGSTKFSVKLRS